MVAGLTHSLTHPTRKHVGLQAMSAVGGGNSQVTLGKPQEVGRREKAKLNELHSNWFKWEIIFVKTLSQLKHLVMGLQRVQTGYNSGYPNISKTSLF